jgi:hypothetical protein
MEDLMKGTKHQFATMQFDDVQETGRQLRSLGLDRGTLAGAVQSALERSDEAGVVAIRGVLESASSTELLEDEAAVLVDFGLQRGARERRAVCRALRESGGATGELFVVHSLSQMRQADARVYMADYFESGGSMESVSEWLRLAGGVLRSARAKEPGTAGVVADAASWLKDVLEEGIDAVIESIEAILDALADAGKRIADVISSVLEWTIAELADLFAALMQVLGGIAEIVVSAYRLVYRLASRIVQALLAAGALIVDILAEAASATYFRFRRIVYGLMEALSDVAAVLEAVFALAANALDALWQRTLQAVTYAVRRLQQAADWAREALEWALAVGATALEGLMRAWEACRLALRDLYEFAAELADDVWEVIGEVAFRIGNSLSYVWEFVKSDLLPAVFSFVRGVLRAGLAVAQVVAWGLQASFQVLVEVVRAALDVGATIGVLIAETVRNPGNLLPNLINALREIGSTLTDLYQAAIVETAEAFVEQVTRALVEMGEAARDMLDAVKQVAAGAVGTVIGVLLSILGTYRPLTAAEIADARTVFGNRIDYSRVRVSVEDITNDIIFGVQDFVTDNPDSRAFVTNTLINFDVGDGLTRHTLIHELTHVRQFESAGPEYLMQAVGAQVIGDGYNYGYTEDQANVSIVTDFAGNTTLVDAGRAAGFGGAAALVAAGGDLNAFNREQQGQIAMHFFVRRELLGVGTVIGSGANAEVVDVAAWQPYVDALRAA